MTCHKSASLAQHSKIIRQTLENIRAAIDVSPGLWLDITDLTSEQYRKIKLGRGELPVTSLTKIAHNLDLNTGMLLNGNIDYVALSEHFIGNATYIPEKYSIGAFSRRRTVVNILDFLTARLGIEARYRILRRFQIKPKSFSEPNEFVNIRLVADALDVAAEMIPHDDLAFMLGAHSVVSFKESPIGLTLRKLRNVSSIYEYIVYELNSLYDENHQYSITHMDRDGCVVHSGPSEKLMDALKTKTPGNVSVCKYRAGVAGSAPTYIGMPMANVRKTHCIHWNDRYCRFEIDFRSTPLIRNNTASENIMRPFCSARVLH